MNTLDHFFKERLLIKHLARSRLQLCQARHLDHFIGQTIGAHCTMARGDELNIFPPRRSWKSCRPRYRHGWDDVLEESLCRIMARYRGCDDDEVWAKNLGQTIEKIRQRALTAEGFQFESPLIRPEEKNREKAEYRPIAKFPMADNVICSLVAKYWRDFFGPVISKSCLSFGFGQHGAPPPQGQDGVASILCYRAQHASHSLYVAEADIVGCFDAIEHQIAWQCFQGLKLQAEKYHGHPADPRAIEILRAYLACYSFADAIKAEAELRRKMRNPQAHFKRPPNVSDQNANQTGIPQGGALSGIIVHSVLHFADLALEKFKKSDGAEFLYWRYVDDMVVVSPDRAICARAYAHYLAALESLHLPFHQPTQVINYDRNYWCYKSKSPFRWDASKQFGSAPWIRFLGYDIRADGLLRISQRSIQRHRKETTDFLRMVWRQALKVNQPRVGLVQLARRIRWRLVAMGTGRHSNQGERNKISWSGCFPLLSDRPHLETQMRDLDRFRERQVLQYRAKLRDRFGRSGRKIHGSTTWEFKTSYVAAFRAKSKAY